MTGKHPYFDTPELAVLSAKFACELPKIPEHPEIPEELIEFWEKCWHTSPIMRPNTEIVLEFLTDFLNRSASSIHDEESSTGHEAPEGAGDQRIEPVYSDYSSGSSSSPSPKRVAHLEAKVPSRVPSRQGSRNSRNVSRNVSRNATPQKTPLLIPEAQALRPLSRQDGRLSRASRNGSRIARSIPPEPEPEIQIGKSTHLN